LIYFFLRVANMSKFSHTIRWGILRKVKGTGHKTFPTRLCLSGLWNLKSQCQSKYISTSCGSSSNAWRQVTSAAILSGLWHYLLVGGGWYICS